MKSKAFTLIELRIVIANIALLLSVVMHVMLVLKEAKEASQRIMYRSNLKQLALANVQSHEEKVVSFVTDNVMLIADLTCEFAY